MGALTRDAILAADDLKRVWVDTPEWGGGVWVRLLTGTERDKFESDNVRFSGSGKDRKGEPNLANIRARLAVLCCCDEAGKRLFADADAEALGRKAGPVLDRIFDKAAALN